MPRVLFAACYCFAVLIVAAVAPGRSSTAQVYPEQDAREREVLYFQATGLDACDRPWERLLRAAELGDAFAFYQLGRVYELGIGVRVDLVKAREWYRKAAEKRHPEAQFRLGLAYFAALGVPVDRVRARRYFEDAARALHPGALERLSHIYREGRGTAKNEALADKYEGFSNIVFKLMVLAGDPTMVDPIASIDEELARRDARRGDRAAKRKLAMYRSRNPEYFRAWWRYATAGEPYAQIRIGDLYSTGATIKGKKDPEAARHWYEKAIQTYTRRAQCKDVDALYTLGLIYEAGEIVPRDARHSQFWFNLAATRGHLESRYRMARFILEGGSESDRKEGVKRLRATARLGHKDSLVFLSLMYEQGEFVERDLAEAYVWAVLSYMYDSTWSEDDVRNLRKDWKKKLSPVQIASGDKRITEWLAKAPR